MFAFSTPARQNYSTFYDNFQSYDNQGLRIDTSEGAANSYQTIINNARPPDPLRMSSRSLHKLSDLKICQRNSTNVVPPAPHLTLEHVLILLDVPNPHGLGLFAD